MVFIDRVVGSVEPVDSYAVQHGLQSVASKPDTDIAAVLHLQ